MIFYKITQLAMTTHTISFGVCLKTRDFQVGSKQRKIFRMPKKNKPESPTSFSKRLDNLDDWCAVEQQMEERVVSELVV